MCHSWTRRAYNTAVARHTAVGAPGDTLDILQHLQHKEETYGDLRNPFRSFYFNYRTHWNFGLRLRRVTVVEHNHILIDAPNHTTVGSWAGYESKVRGTAGEMREKKYPMGILRVNFAEYDSEFNRISGTNAAKVRAATRHLAGTLLHEFMHAEGYDHVGGPNDPDYARSINDIFDWALVDVLSGRAFPLAETPLIEEERRVLSQLPKLPK